MSNPYVWAKDRRQRDRIANHHAVTDLDRLKAQQRNRELNPKEQIFTKLGGQDPRETET